MPLIGAVDVALDPVPGVQAIPAGFLRARMVGATAGSTEYLAVIESVLASVAAHLDAVGVSSDSTVPRYKMAARHLARYYAAEAVLANADVGSDRDQTGASSALSASDLAHWERMRDTNLAAADRILGKVEGVQSGVYFAPIRLTDDAAS